MSGGVEAASSAMSAYALAQEVTARNIANLMTPGFKRNVPVFRVKAGAEGETAAASSDASESEVGVERVAVDFSQGDLLITGNDLDVAIRGEGFFTVQGEKSTRYTRNGNFTINHNGVLSTQRGDPVLGAGGEIQVPPGTARIVIASRGIVRADGQEIGRLKIAAFENPERLEQKGAGEFIDRGAVPRDPAEFEVRQGSLERSNVDPIGEMVRMMANMREYEACARSLKSVGESAQRLYAWARS